MVTKFTQKVSQPRHVTEAMNRLQSLMKGRSVALSEINQEPVILLHFPANPPIDSEMSEKVRLLLSRELHVDVHPFTVLSGKDKYYDTPHMAYIACADFASPEAQTSLSNPELEWGRIVARAATADRETLLTDTAFNRSARAKAALSSADIPEDPHVVKVKEALEKATKIDWKQPHPGEAILQAAIGVNDPETTADALRKALGLEGDDRGLVSADGDHIKVHAHGIKNSHLFRLEHTARNLSALFQDRRNSPERF